MLKQEQFALDFKRSSKPINHIYVARDVFSPCFMFFRDEGISSNLSILVYSYMTDNAQNNLKKNVLNTYVDLPTCIQNTRTLFRDI